MWKGVPITIRTSIYIMKRFLVALAAVSAASLSSASTIVSGVHFEVLLTPMSIKSDKVYIQEFFSYNCGTCAKQSNIVQQVSKRWGDKVHHVEVPMSGLNTDSTPKIYYALEKINAPKSAHNELLRLGAATPESPLTVKEMSTILQGKGVNLTRFNGMYSSVDITKKERAAAALVSRYQISHESAVVVNGRFLVKGNAEKLGLILNHLITKEHERKSRKTP